MAGLTDTQIDILESEIGCALPPDVRSRYTEADGFVGPTDCKLLYPYVSDTRDQITRVNTSLKFEDWFPSSRRSTVVLGDDGCGNLLCFDPDTNTSLLWNPADGDWIQESFPTVTELWQHVVSQYENHA